MNDKKKKYLVPEAEIVSFTISEDIITTSTLTVGGELGDFGGDGYDENF